ncbi:MAG: family 16 glycoside hydrolase [Anaerolineae bacterium]
MMQPKNKKRKARLAGLLLILIWLAGCSQAVPLSEQDVVFADGFVAGEMGSWVLEADSLGRTAVVDEKLLIEINQSDTMQYAALDDQSFTDFALEVDAEILTGHPESSYGVLFRMMDAARFYRFEITGTGLYMVERHNPDGSWTRLLDDWQESEAINQGEGAVNRMKVVAAGSGFALYTNDSLILQFTDTVYPSGTIALDAGTFGVPDLQVVFDNVVIR